MALLSWNQFTFYQPSVGRMLQNSIQTNRLSHSYIFEGPIGTKRIDAAFLLAKTLLCTQKDDHANPCGVCHHCTRVDKNVHPNLFFVQNDNKEIRKEQIKELLVEFGKASIETGPRIYIIDQAERFNQYSANILLKTMEEPGVDIFQILITTQINSLLKTIISRSQILHFRPIDKCQIKSDLEKEGFSPLLASAVSEYTTNIDMAREMVENPLIVDSVQLVIEMARSLQIKEKSIVLHFKEKRSAILGDMAITDFFLTMLTLFLKDILNYKVRYLDLLVFTTETELIGKLSEAISQKRIEELLDKMLGLKSRLKYNINVALAFDKLLAYLERGFDHGISSSSSSI
ncbi:MAG: DNA polymerase III subunit delta' C-terminal domain-containing protein [Candidatus Izemoplasmatales bacterium]